MLNARSLFRLLPPTLVAVLALGGVMSAGAAVPGAEGAKDPVRFQASTRETVVVVPCAPNHLCLSITGPGDANRLGHVSESANYDIDLLSAPAPGCNSGTGTMTLTGATGDSLSLALYAWGCQSGPTSATNVLLYWVTGGTGRLSGATGYGTETVFADLSDPAHPTAVTYFDGSLSAPDSR